MKCVLSFKVYFQKNIQDILLSIVLLNKHRAHARMQLERLRGVRRRLCTVELYSAVYRLYSTDRSVALLPPSRADTRRGDQGV